MSNLKIDPGADAAYMYFNDSKVSYTLPIGTGIIADYDENGLVVGIEVLFVSKQPSLNWSALQAEALRLTKGPASRQPSLNSGALQAEALRLIKGRA